MCESWHCVVGAVLCCIVLCCVSHGTVLWVAVLCCTVLYCVSHGLRLLLPFAAKYTAAAGAVTLLLYSCYNQLNFLVGSTVSTYRFVSTIYGQLHLFAGCF